MALASALLQTMIDAVRKTARPMLRDFGEVAQLQVSRKGPADFVTAADIKAEQTLFATESDLSGDVERRRRRRVGCNFISKRDLCWGNLASRGIMIMLRSCCLFDYDMYDV